MLSVPRSSARRTATCARLVLVVLALTACGRTGRGTDGITPVSAGTAPSAAQPTTTGRATGPSTTDGGAVQAAAPADPTQDAMDVVAATLERYGSVLGQLSADPAGAPAPGTAARAAWDQVVVPGSALSEELLDRIHRRATEERVVVRPDAAGISFRHRPVSVDAVGPTEIEFRWCGWSPGIGTSIDSGAVVDDEVAHATGTGRLVATDGVWRLATLDQLDLELLPPGSPDPCPTVDRDTAAGVRR